MKKWLPVLILLCGLGDYFSSAQSNPTKRPSDPFDRYLQGVKMRLPESASQRIANECKIDISQVEPRFAVNPGAAWMPVKDLARGLHNLESDFYSTAEVWSQGGRVLVEIWPISADVGSEVRVIRCFEGGKLLQAEAVDWTVPVMQAPGITAWGYYRRWVRGANGRLERTDVRFVDEMEQTIPKPKLDLDDERELKWIPSLGPLSELKLPPAVLR